MIKIKYLCLAILVITWGGYYANFVVNPILSFFTIYLLIQSIGLQRDSNNNLVNEIKRQEKLEEYKKFELRFFRLLESQESSFTRFKINVEENADGSIQTLSGGAAVTFIEDNLSVLIAAKIDRARIAEWIKDLDGDDAYFSLTRRFYLILKLVDDNTTNKDERSDMYETLLNLTDIKVIIMIAILSVYYDWDVMKYIKASNILNREGLKEFVPLYTV